MKKKSIGLFVFVALISIFAFNANVYADVSCAAIPDAVIDDSIPNIVSTIVKAIQIVVPILLVVLGMFDFVKGVTAAKEDEIKKGQQTFIKRIFAAVLVFFIIAIVKLVISLVAGDDKDSIMGCVNCFLNGADSCQPAGAAAPSNSNTISTN